jgi:chemotaxis protein methyltransferase CheR
MRDDEWVRFLQWSLPRLGLRWAGFRRVRRQVVRRVRARVAELGLDGPAAYRARLERQPGEWRRLDPLCRVTISRCYRDRGVYDRLAVEVLPALAEAARARGARRVDAWSAGCASGEEPYGLALLWRFRLQARQAGLKLRILATDADAALLERARQARYPAGALRELDPAWVEQAFDRDGATRVLRSPADLGVTFLQQDLREVAPDGRFDLVLCRNLAFTYYDAALQERVLGEIVEHLEPGGALVLGAHESLPGGGLGLEACPDGPCIYRRGTGSS